MHSRTAWVDYFTGSPTSLLQTTKYDKRQSLSGTGVCVSNCLFSSITSSSYGGALYSRSETYFLIESTSFFICKTSDYHGGAIFFENGGNSQCVLYKVCGYGCCSTHSSNPCDMFAYIYVSTSSSSSIKNYFNYSSISRCVSENSNSYYTIRLYFGKIICPSVNISQNKCYYRPVICSHPYSDSNSYTSSITYSTFADNIATGYRCISLWNTGSKHEIKSCNILRNTQGTVGTEGILYIEANVIISDSCILENKATRIFHSYSTYTFTLSNCTVDKTSNNGYLTIQNTVTKSFILGLNHMSTQNCHSEYDSAGYLTHIVQTPSSSKKPVICHTYGKYFYQPQLSDFFSLISSFIINFINPYAFSYH
jgi:hypothetical protein